MLNDYEEEKKEQKKQIRRGKQGIGATLMGSLLTSGPYE